MPPKHAPIRVHIERKEKGDDNAATFQEGNVIILTALSTGARKGTLSAPQGGAVIGTGKNGPWARWIVRKLNFDLRLARYTDPTKFLRIHNDQLDCNGTEHDPATLFRLVDGRGEIVSFASRMFVGSHIGVRADGHLERPSKTVERKGVVEKDGQFIARVVDSVGLAPTLPTQTEGLFRDGAVIHLTSKSHGKNLRILPDGSVDGKGETGDFAKFRVHKTGEGTVRLQAVAASQKERFLRINPDTANAGRLDGEGGRGPYTVLRVKAGPNGTVSLESVQMPGRHVGVVGSGDAKHPLRTGTGTDGQFTPHPAEFRVVVDEKAIREAEERRQAIERKQEEMRQKAEAERAEARRRAEEREAQRLQDQAEVARRQREAEIAALVLKQREEAEEAMRRQLAAEEERRKAAEAEREREWERMKAEAAERQRIADEKERELREALEAQLRAAAAAEAKRQAEEAAAEEKRRAEFAAAEQKRLAALAEAERAAAAEAARLEEERRQKAYEEEQKRKREEAAREEERKKKAAEEAEEKRRKEAEEAEERRRQEQKAAEEKRKADAEAAQRKHEEDLANMKRQEISTAVQSLRKAMEGAGTNEGLLVATLSGKSVDQLNAIREAYNTDLKRDLARDIKDETSSDFRNALLALIEDTNSYDASLVKAGLSNDKLLIEVLCTRSADELKAISEAFSRDHKGNLFQEVAEHTSGKLKNLFSHCLGPKPSDDNLLLDHVKKLYDAGEGKIGTDDTKFIQILGKYSRSHVMKVAEIYEKQYGKSLVETIKCEFSGELEDALVALATPRDVYFAQRLNAAMEGVGADESAMIRLIVGNRSRDLKAIAAAYQSLFGQSLKSAVQSEVSGNFRLVLVAVLANFS